MRFHRHTLLAYTMAALLFIESVVLLGCGGNATHTTTVNSVSQSIATAKTQDAMHRAYLSAAKLVGYDQPLTQGTQSAVAISANVYEGYEQLQLNEPEAAYPTFARAFEIVNENPDLHGLKLNMTLDQVLADLNGKLTAAYANRNSASNALLILLSSKPGAIPATAPVVTADTKLSAVQQFVLPKYLAQLMISRGACEIACNAAYYAAVGVIGALVAACSEGSGFILVALCIAIGAADLDLAAKARDACVAACHNQGGN